MKQAAVKHEFSGHKYQRRTGRDDTLAGLRPSGDALKTTKGWVWPCRLQEMPLLLLWGISHLMSSDIRGGRIRTDGPSSSLNTTEPGRPPHNSSVAIETGLLFNAVAVIVAIPPTSALQAGNQVHVSTPTLGWVLAVLCCFSLFIQDQQHLLACLWVFVCLG